MSAAAVIPIAQPASEASLLRIDDDLHAHLNTLDLLEPGTPEHAECEAAIQRFMVALPSKVDGVAAAYRWLKARAAIAKAEKEFYGKRQAKMERLADGLEGYIVHVLKQQPEPKRGPKKLEGDRYTLALGSSEVVKILNDDTIPASYKSATIEISAEDLQRVVANCPWLTEGATPAKVTISTRASDVKKALKDGVEIAGADLETNYHLRIT